MIIINHYIICTYMFVCSQTHVLCCSSQRFMSVCVCVCVLYVCVLYVCKHTPSVREVEVAV